MTDLVNMEMEITATGAGEYRAALSASIPGRDGLLEKTGPVTLDLAALRALLTDPAAYGLALSRGLFASDALRQGFTAVKSAAGAGGLRFRLRIAGDAARLHGLLWETLRDPEDGTVLTTSGLVRFSRYLSGPGLPRYKRPKGDLRALAAVSGPADASVFGLAPVRVDEELERARASLSGVRVDTLPRVFANGDWCDDPRGRKCTLNDLVEALVAETYDILYLVCHGFLRGDQPALALQGPDGSTEWVAGQEFARRLGALANPPRLVVLASCNSGGTGDEESAAGSGELAAVGPLLVLQGIPAVVAMQGSVKVRTVSEFMPPFFRALARDGEIDAAVAAARADVLHLRRTDWWSPVLFMNLVSGRLWEEDDEPAGPQVADLLRRVEEELDQPRSGINIQASTVHIGGSVVSGPQTVYNFGPRGEAALKAQFEEIYALVYARPIDDDIDPEELRDTLKRIEREVNKGAQARPEAVARWLKNLRGSAPDIYEPVLALLLSGGPGVPPGVQRAAQAVKEEAA